MNYLLIILSCILLLLVYFIYRRFFEKRYEWVTCHYLVDDEGDYVLIYYTDKKKPGIFSTKLYHRTPSRSIVDTYIKSLNNYERRNKGKL